MQVKSTGELEKLSSRELVEMYNSLKPPKPVKRFSDHETAVKRVLGLLAVQQVHNAPPPSKSMPRKADFESAPVVEPKKTKSPAPVVQNTDPRLVHKAILFDYPVRRDANGKPDLRPYRPNTKRALVLDMLRRGTTFEEVMSHPRIGWDRRTAFEGIKLLHSYLGYGIREEADGRLFLLDT